MNDRFDHDLRRAAAPLAQEPLSSGVLDSRLGEGAPGAGRPRLVAVLAGGVAVAVAALIGLGQLGPDTGQPSPSPSVEASLPTDEGTSAACDEELAPEPGVDEVLTYFMCEPPPAEPRALIREGSSSSEPAEELRIAIEALLAGPTAAERERGYSSVFPPNSEDLLARVAWQEDGLAIIDFHQAVTEGALNSSHNRFVLFRTLEETAFQFDAVTAIEYRLEGSCADFAAYFETICDHTVKSEALTSVLDCPIVPPAELPSGAATTVARVNVPAPFSQVSWGSGTDTVTQRVARHTDDEPTRAPDHEPVSIRGEMAFITQVDDLPESSIQIAWIEGECAYINWVSGMTFDEAIDFARRFDGG